MVQEKALLNKTTVLKIKLTLTQIVKLFFKFLIQGHLWFVLCGTSRIIIKV